jgi:hypothetical protein
MRRWHLDASGIFVEVSVFASLSHVAADRVFGVLKQAL